MKLALLTSLCLCCFEVATRGATPPAVVAFQLVTAEGQRWQVIEAGHEAWLARPPVQQMAPVLQLFNQYQALKRDDSAVKDATSAASQEYARIHELRKQSRGAVRRQLSAELSVIRARQTQLKERSKVLQKQLEELSRKAAPRKLDPFTFKVVAEKLDWRIDEKTVWQYLGPEPAAAKSK